jgi:serine phosphatase RsbU (regulator of sigma subunit)
LLVTSEGELLELEGTEHPALGLGEHARRFTIDRRRLEPGERLLLISDGVLDRRTSAGESFGMAGVRAALAGTHDAAASTVRALEDAITAASSDPLEDDATIVVFAPTDP